MGARLEQIFDLVELKKGLAGRMRLVVRCGISKKKAGSLPDDPDVVNHVKTVAGEILQADVGQFIRF